MNISQSNLSFKASICLRTCKLEHKNENSSKKMEATWLRNKGEHKQLTIAKQD